jgi:predicted transcriptional regulator
MRSLSKTHSRLLFGIAVNIVNYGKTTMQYRDKTEIIRQILDIANDAVNITKTKICTGHFLAISN